LKVIKAIIIISTRAVGNDGAATVTLAYAQIHT